MMRTWADALATEKFNKVFVGFNSFAATQNLALIEEWTPELKAEAKSNFGGFFGTSRNIMMTDPAVQEIAIKNLKSKNIDFVGVLGGDGSSRCLAKIANTFMKAGIVWAFLMPATIDGIEGSCSFGLKAAVRTSCYIIEQLVSTCLNTLNVTEAATLVVELQGRNRDDILAHVLENIYSNQLNFGRIKPRVVAVPANYQTTVQGLVNLRQLEEPILLLLSEGATFKRSDIKSFLHGKKVRSFEVAHLSQMNRFTTSEDKNEIKQAVSYVAHELSKLIDMRRPFALAYDDFSKRVTVNSIDYYAKNNPEDAQCPTLDKRLEDIVRRYLL